MKLGGEVEKEAHRIYIYIYRVEKGVAHATLHGRRGESE